MSLAQTPPSERYFNHMVRIQNFFLEKPRKFSGLHQQHLE